MNTLAEITSTLVGTKYQLGQLSPDKGLDCFSLVYLYLEHKGYRLPKEYTGIRLDNYSQHFIDKPSYAKSVMESFISSVLEETHKPVAGDILLLNLRADKTIFLGIHAGNGMVVLCNEKYGVTVASLEYYRIRRAWKCQQQSQ